MKRVSPYCRFYKMDSLSLQLKRTFFLSIFYSASAEFNFKTALEKNCDEIKKNDLKIDRRESTYMDVIIKKCFSFLVALLRDLKNIR